MGTVRHSMIEKCYTEYTKLNAATSSNELQLKTKKKVIFILRINDQTLFEKKDIIFLVIQITEETPQYYLGTGIRKQM